MNKGERDTSVGKTICAEAFLSVRARVMFRDHSPVAGASGVQIGVEVDKAGV